MGTSFAKGLSTEYIFLEFHLSMDITSIQISTVGIWISMMKIGITVYVLRTHEAPMYVTMYRSRTFGPSFDYESKSSDDHVKT